MKDRKTPNIEQFKVVTEVIVRFFDVDKMGHLNNAVFFTFFEEARTEYFRQLKLSALDFHPQASLSFILAEISCTFLAPGSLGEKLRVYTRVSAVGEKSFAMEYLIVRPADRALLATGKSIQVMYNYLENRSIPIPSEIKKRFEEIDSVN